VQKKRERPSFFIVTPIIDSTALIATKPEQAENQKGPFQGPWYPRSASVLQEKLLLLAEWCGERELNPHDLAITRT
jgi:hypothetical protein